MSAPTRKQIDLMRQLKGHEMQRLDRVLTSTNDESYLDSVTHRVSTLLRSLKRLTPEQQALLIETIKDHVEVNCHDDATKNYILERLGYPQAA